MLFKVVAGRLERRYDDVLQNGERREEFRGPFVNQLQLQGSLIKLNETNFAGLDRQDLIEDEPI